MNIRLQIKYYSKDHTWLCFRHAVQLATQGVDIETDIGDFDSEFYMGDTTCNLCHEERYSPYVRAMFVAYKCSGCGRHFSKDTFEENPEHMLWKGNIPVRCGEIEKIEY